MTKRTARRTPGQVPGMDFVDEIVSSETVAKESEAHYLPKKRPIFQEIAEEIRSEREEDLVTISARVPRSVAKKIKEEAFYNELNVGTYLRKFLARAFTQASGDAANTR